MDTQWYGSIAGIIGGTLIIVEVLKRALGNVAIVKAVPTWVYSVVVAVILTYASRAAGLLTDQGSTLDILMTAIMLAGSASGFWTWLRSPGDQIKDSAPATNQRFDRTLPVILLAVALSGAVGCGKNLAPELVAAEDAVHDALADAQDGIDRACAPKLTPAVCQQVNAALVPALKAGAQFNRVIASQQLQAVGSLVESVGALIKQVQQLTPGALRDAIVADLRRAINAAFNIGGQS